MISDKLISVDNLRQFSPESCWLVGPVGVRCPLRYACGGGTLSIWSASLKD